MDKWAEQERFIESQVSWDLPSGEIMLQNLSDEKGGERLGWKIESLLIGVAYGSVLIGLADGMAIAQVLEGQAFKSIGDVLSTPTDIHLPLAVTLLSTYAGQIVTERASSFLGRSVTG